ncbi:Uncharacterised protein [Bordetella pertussis]|nr:Uncharacterised protein [Bordetella pertussis]CFO12515.1 Uncharacterised protein [Bordetella pertussis]CFO72837.1 Uncharacterised protein [Bordetella pertussis]CFP60067.1 Uncharacterised protein [Bordetella pertussis]CFU83767.1 Uncharacterised protein [Bordetella pertussis]
MYQVAPKVLGEAKVLPAGVISCAEKSSVSFTKVE